MSTNNQVEEAIQLIKSGQKAQAYEILKSILDKDRDNVRGWAAISQIAKTKPEAASHLQEVLRIKPGNEWATNQLARLDSQQEETLRPAGKGKSHLKRFWQDSQDPEAVEKIYNLVGDILTPNEEIEYIAVQHNLINLSPDAIALTNKRFIIYRPELLGGASFIDYIWRDLRDARLKEGIRRSTITIKTVKGTQITIDQLPKVQARKVYSAAQAREEEAREERRQRELENSRAGAGGIVVQGSIPAVASQPVAEDPLDALRKLKTMADEGLISEEEFESKKSEIMGRM